MNDGIRKRGRPPSATSLASAQVNYEALAWQVRYCIEEGFRNGVKITIKDAIQGEMRYAKRRDCQHDGLMDARFDTAYIEVRKILKRWKKIG